MSKKSYIILLIVLIAVTVLIFWGFTGCNGNAGNSNFDGESYLTRNNQNYQNVTYVTGLNNGNENISFYLVLRDEKVRIYIQEDGSFYDYADINIEILPKEILEQLRLGMYIDGEPALYEFLQTYSS